MEYVLLVLVLLPFAVKAIKWCIEMVGNDKYFRSHGGIMHISKHYSMEAQIIDVKSVRSPSSRDRFHPFETTVYFSDGCFYTSDKRTEKPHLFSYELKIDDDALKTIFRDAVAAHKAANDRPHRFF